MIFPTVLRVLQDKHKPLRNVSNEEYVHNKFYDLNLDTQICDYKVVNAIWHIYRIDFNELEKLLNVKNKYDVIAKAEALLKQPRKDD